jgi:hypothetical protein
MQWARRECQYAAFRDVVRSLAMLKRYALAPNLQDSLRRAMRSHIRRGFRVLLGEYGIQRVLQGCRPASRLWMPKHGLSVQAFRIVSWTRRPRVGQGEARVLQEFLISER